MKLRNKICFGNYNKRHLRADDYLSLSSALRPRLLGSTINNLSKVSSLKHKLMFPLGLVSSIITLSIISSIVLPNLFNSISNISAASLTLSVPSSISLNVSPSANSGFGESSSSEVKVITTGTFGYTLNISAKDSNDNNLKNGNNVLKPITKTDGYVDSDAYKNSNELNTWAYKINKLNNEANTKYLPFPIVETLIEKTNNANRSNTPNNYNLTIAAKIDNTLSSGLYQNNFILSAVANTVSYSITYNLNQGSWNGKSPQTGSTTESSVKLDDNTPTRDGYEFMGWCTKEPTGNDTNSPSCEGQAYEAGQDYTLINGANNVQLWAMWKQLKPATPPTTMQDFKNYCIFMEQEEMLTLLDTRDNSSYRIVKLQDNRCWMIDNLKIVNKTITSSDSDITANTWSIPSSNLYGFNYYDSINVYYPNTKRNGVDIGALYNWYAATAGTGNNMDANEVASSSICPKGWRLPKGGTDSEFAILDKAMGGNGLNRTDSAALNRFVKTPIPGFIYNGNVAGSNHNNLDRIGHYWTSASYSSSFACSFDFVTDGTFKPAIGEANASNKYWGYGIRCISYI